MIIYIYYIDYSWEQVPNSCSLRFIVHRFDIDEALFRRGVVD